MKITKFLVPILLLTSLNLSIIASQGEKKGYFNKMAQTLNLSKDQLEKIKEYKNAHKGERGSFKEIKELRQKIEQAFLENASDEIIKELHGKIKVLREKGEDAKLSKMIAFKNLLNEEQRKKFLEFKKDRRSKGKK